MPKYGDENPLHQAVELGQTDRVRLILDSGGKVDSLTRDHTTPLMVAARHRQPEIAKLLIERGANVNAKNRRNSVWEGSCTALHEACRVGCIEVMQLLLVAGADPDCASQTWNTPLTDAILGGRQRAVALLLEHGANPDGPEKCDEPPIVAAARKNDHELLSKLLSRGANPNRYCGNWMTALGVTNSVECARCLVQSGANVNATDGHGVRPIHYHTESDDIAMLRYLIEAGADLNALSGGKTPLMLLAMRPRYAAACLLIESGADVNAVGDYGTALDFCSQMQDDNFSGERGRIANLLRRNSSR